MELNTEIQARDTNTAIAEARNLREWLQKDKELSNMELGMRKATTETEEQAGDGREGILQVNIDSTDAPQLARSIQNWLREHPGETAENLRFQINKGDKTETVYPKDTENPEQAITKAIREVLISDLS